MFKSEKKNGEEINFPFHCRISPGSFQVCFMKNKQRILGASSHSPRVVSVMGDLQSPSYPPPDPDGALPWPAARSPCRDLTLLTARSSGSDLSNLSQQNLISTDTFPWKVSVSINQHFPRKNNNNNKKPSSWKTPSTLRSLLSATESQYCSPSPELPLHSNFERKRS